VLPLHVWVVIVSGFFQALGKPVSATVMGLSRQLFSLIPCILILTWLFGLDGLIRAQATADAVAFLLALLLVIPTLRQLSALTSGGDSAADL
jgi:Na+-driven multidrug efflux pump